MELILVRHARPEQVAGMAGGADPALTAIGHRQARAAAAWLAAEHLDGLYVSPMVRARQTAQPLERLIGSGAVVVDGVREYDAEHPSYTPVEVLRQDKEAWRQFLAEEDAVDRSEWVRLVAETLEDIIERHRGQRVAVVCHGGVINAWATTTLGIEPKLFFNPDYTSINRFVAASSGERSIVSLNETGHLRGAPDLRL
ncbi:MAG: histidine phosphatase family protein [Acidimicrobiia bacterium]|nr:histidine phosphatase family protein [Acidimicrobiia bacterium]